MNNLFETYNAYMTLGMKNEAEIIIRNIYETLLYNQYTPYDMEDIAEIREILEDDFELELKDIPAHDYLLRVLYDYALGEIIEDRGQDVEEDMEVHDMYIVTLHELDLENGHKEKGVAPFIFLELDEVLDYLNFRLEMESLEASINQPSMMLGVSDLLAREDLIELLVNQGATFETIAESIPELCLGAAVIVKNDKELARVVSASIYSVYKMDVWER